MGLVDAAVAIYLAGFMGVLGVICIIGYFKNFHGKKEGREEDLADNLLKSKLNSPS